MGPRTLVRGNAQRAAHHRASIPLQWGRALSCAEIRGPDHDARDRHGFNGAAHSRARKSQRPLHTTQHTVSSFNGAAHSRARKWMEPESFNALVVASMGPRTLVRGNS